MEANIINSGHIKSFFDALTAIKGVSSDIIFCCTPSFLSVRALNSSQTSLPVLMLKESFFGDYIYNSDHDTVSFQMESQCIKFLKRISDVSSVTIKYNTDELAKENKSSKVIFELIGKYNFTHIFEFFTSETSVFDAVQNSESLLSATVVVDELYQMKNTFKCPYIILTYKVDDDDVPFLSFESFNSVDTARQSLFTIKNSTLCKIMTDNDCRIILSYADFIQIIKIAKAINSEHIDISAGNPGTAFILKASNGAGSLKLIASLATLADDDFITSSLSSQASTFSASHVSKKNKQSSDEEAANISISPPESPLRARITAEAELNENGRLSSSNNSQYTTSTQVVPWKNNSQDEFSASPEFPSKRKHSENNIVIGKSQPTDDEYNDDEDDEEVEPNESNDSRAF